MGVKYLGNQKNAACAHHPVKMMVPHDGGPAMDGDDDCDPRSSTDLARAWEAIPTLRLRGQVLQLVPLDASSVMLIIHVWINQLNHKCISILMIELLYNVRLCFN